MCASNETSLHPSGFKIRAQKKIAPPTETMRWKCESPRIRTLCVTSLECSTPTSPKNTTQIRDYRRKAMNTHPLGREARAPSPTSHGTEAPWNPTSSGKGHWLQATISTVTTASHGVCSTDYWRIPGSVRSSREKRVQAGRLLSSASEGMLWGIWKGYVICGGWCYQNLNSTFASCRSWACKSWPTALLSRQHLTSRYSAPRWVLRFCRASEDWGGCGRVS